MPGPPHFHAQRDPPVNTPDQPEWPADAIEVGRIIDAYGIKGWLRVQPYAADPQALFSSRRWFLQPPEKPVTPSAGATAAAHAAFPTLLRITEAREQGEGIVASVKDISDRNAAEALRGARIFVSRSSFPTAGDGEYYWIDLIGLDVVTREGVPLGQVEKMIDNGAQSVLCIVQPAPADAGADAKPQERLIPFVDHFVDSVDLAARRIVVDWGLDY
jgi:16S rRNA processing protein RimM